MEKKHNYRSYSYRKDPEATRVMLNLDGETSKWLMAKSEKTRQAVSQVIRQLLWVAKDAENNQ